MGKVKRPASGITDEQARALADRLERLEVADLGWGRPGPGAPGRPSLSGVACERSPKIQARVTRTLYEKVDKHAHANGTTVSDVLREALQKAADTW